MRIDREIDICIVQRHLERLRSAVRLPYQLTEYRAYRVQLEAADAARLTLWWQFAKRTENGSSRVVDLLTSCSPHPRTRSFIEGDPAQGRSRVDLRTAKDLELVAVASDLQSDMLYIIDGNNRAVAQQIMYGSFQDVPLLLCIHPEINDWSVITSKLTTSQRRTLHNQRCERAQGD